MNSLYLRQKYTFVNCRISVNLDFLIREICKILQYIIFLETFHLHFALITLTDFEKLRLQASFTLVRFVYACTLLFATTTTLCCKLRDSIFYAIKSFYDVYLVFSTEKAPIIFGNFHSKHFFYWDLANHSQATNDT